MKNPLILRGLGFIAIILLLNILADELFFRVDFTEEKRYTLSDASRNILKNINSDIVITAYFSEDLPPDVDRIRTEFKDLLIEYANLSAGKIQFEFVNPNESPELEQEALDKGIAQVSVSIREKDKVNKLKVYLGAVIKNGDNVAEIPVIEPDSPMEYMLSKALKKVNSSEKPKIGVIQSYNVFPLDHMADVKQELSVNYTLVPLVISPAQGIPADINNVILVGPRDTLPEATLAHLDGFLAKGGNLFVALNRVEGDIQTSYGKPIYTGVETWLEKKGLKIEPNFVLDINCGGITVQEMAGAYAVERVISFPYIPIIRKFSEHPITKGLEQMVLVFASDVMYTGSKNNKFTPLMYTSDASAIKGAPHYFDLQHQWQRQEFPNKALITAASLEGALVSDKEAKIVVIGDADFIVNGPADRAQTLSPDNINFISNAMDWMVDDLGLIGLRTREVKSRPIIDMDEDDAAIYKYINFLLPVVLVVLYGFVRFQRNRMKRTKRMNDTY